MEMEIETIGSQLEVYDFDYLMDRALERVSSEIDKREGSIIYDALAPACMELALMYMALRQFYQATFIQTSYGGYLDAKVAERGLKRHPATHALRLGVFTNTRGEPFSPPEQMRFATIHLTDDAVHFMILKHTETVGECVLQCVETGTIGNGYVGELLPIDHVNGLGTAQISSVIEPAQNAETDGSLRARFLASVHARAFGGNVIQYRKEVLGIDGVGAVQVHPIWQGGGTVKVSILDGDFNPVSETFIKRVQNVIDPDCEGQGLGLAPIGHQVTVSTAAKYPIDVTIHGLSGVNVSQTAIKAAIEAHFEQLRRSWSDYDELNQFNLSVFRSQIMAAVLSVEGVTNVVAVLLNHAHFDVSLEQSGTLQQLPYVGEVAVHVV